MTLVTPLKVDDADLNFSDQAESTRSSSSSASATSSKNAKILGQKIVKKVQAGVNHRLTAAWVLWAGSMMLNAFVDVWIQDHVINNLDGGVLDASRGHILYDIGFHYLPFIPSRRFGFSLPDFIALINTVLAVAKVIIEFKPARALIVLRRALCVAGVAYVGRALSIPQTLLPNPDPDCKPNLLGDLFSSAMRVPFGLSTTCTDVFYSGHTIPITCSLLIWTDYVHPMDSYRSKGIWLAFASYFIIVATHFHYTLDVTYAWGATWIVWRLYHFALSVPAIVLNSPLILWWESRDAMGSIKTPESLQSGRFEFGLYPLRLYDDPRIKWSFKSKSSDCDNELQVRKVRPPLSQAQYLALAVLFISVTPTFMSLIVGWYSAMQNPQDPQPTVINPEITALAQGHILPLNFSR